MNIETNEIRDAIKRMPQKRFYNGLFIVDCSRVRRDWFLSISQGTIHERINRRADLKIIKPAFYESSFKHIQKSIRRNHAKKYGYKYY